MPVFLAPILAFFASAIAKTIIDKILFFLALKAVLTFLFIVIVPIIFNNILADLMTTMLNVVDTVAVQNGTIDGGMSFSGVAAWLIECFQVSACLSVLTAAMQLRLALSMIPFIGFKG
jgi:hypothetical protein